MTRIWARGRGAALMGLGLVLAVWAVPGPGRAQMLDDPEYMMIHKGKPVGPYFVEELQVRMRMGRLRSETLIWTEGMEDWQAAGKVPAVSKIFNPSLPPIPEERDFDQFVQGTWTSEPITTEISGMGRGVVTGRTEYRADGTYSFAGQVSVTDAAGVARTILLSSEGSYAVTRKTLERFEISYDAPVVMTTKAADPAGADSVESIAVPPAEFDVIDDNTIRDAQGTVSRRKI